jgi:hypothetical protein
VDAFDYIKNHVFVKIKPSKISGVGVFAIKDIPISTFIFQPWLGESGRYPISESDLQKLPKELFLHIKDIFLYSPDFPKDTNTYVTLTNGCHWIYTTPYYFVNSGGDKYNIDKDTLLTTRNIKQGEEILSNYGRYERLQKKDLI